VIIALAVVVVSLVPGTALAHPLLVRAEPADSARLQSAPHEVRLWFSDPLSPQLSSVQVLDVHGVPVVGAKLLADSARLGHLAVELPDLEPGAYNVVWKVFSESDGHTVRGHLVFGIGAAAVESAAPAPTPEPQTLEVVVRWLGLSATLALVGAVVVGADSRRPHYAVLCGAVAVLAGVATATQTDVFAGLITDSRWGMVWAAREALLLLLIALLATRRTPRSIIAALCLGVLLTQALSGHASGSPIGVVIDALHLLAASVWLGGLLALLVVQRPVSRATWLSFGRIAALCFGVLVATGLYSAGQQAASVDALLATLYGHSLLIKVGLVLLLALAGLASALITRRRRATRFLILEAGVGGLVVLAASVLASSAPARGPNFDPPSAVPTVASQSAHDLLVALEIKPNQPGLNVLTLRAASTRRPALARIERLALEFTPPEASDPIVTLDALQVEPGLFRLGGDFLQTPGTWHIQVIAQRSGLADEAVRFDWAVSPPIAPRVQIVSDQPLAPPLTAAAAAIGLATLLVAAIARLALPRPQRRLRILSSHTHVHQEGVST
jgi:copper transport protein